MRILQGENTTIEEHPYQVSLHKSGWFICGGSIISEYYVLTAAHCLIHKKVDELAIRAGSTNKSSGGDVYKVESVALHEDYRRGNRYRVSVNDIGLVRVTKPFIYDSTRKPIQMFRSGETTKTDEIAVITGWGWTKWPHGTTPDILQKVNVSIVDLDDCIKAYEPRRIPEGQICAGDSHKGTCKGDSGGALVIKGRQAGIVSYTKRDGSSKYPTVYTEVAYYYKWIENKIKQ